MTDDEKRRAALFQALKRKAAPMRVTIDNIVAAGELVRDGLAEPIEVAQVLHVRLLTLDQQASEPRRGL